MLGFTAATTKSGGSIKRRMNGMTTFTAVKSWQVGPQLQELEKSAGQVYVAMNNHYQGKAAINAKMLEGLLISS